MPSSSQQCWSPTVLNDALELLAQHGEDTTILAGGTDLMVVMEMGAIKPQKVLNIWGLNELRNIHEDNEQIVIGSLTTYTEIIQSTLIQTHLPTLVESARLVGALQIQNRGTLGGNLANASPAADTPPVLLAAGGSVELTSISGTRSVDLDHFFKGYRLIDRNPNELLTAIRINKKRANQSDWFCKVGTRQAQSISKVVMGARATWKSDGSLASARIGAGSVAATTVRMPQTEALFADRNPDSVLETRVKQAASSELTPIDDVRSTAQYRAAICGNLAARFVRALMVAPEKP
ncbi:MAG TPA: xanthine dehydrogenase family protein subunit M [Myxococcales bacterium]|nr:xanthine dehydrogenase family protein subunit M [Myxococcales bacterium]